MSDLIHAHCEPCRGGVPPLTDDEIRELLPAAKGWDVANVGGVRRLTRSFAFPDFATAMGFARRVGDLAEEERHHPDLHVAWGRVTVETWTHKIRGLHRNDFILAAKINAIAPVTPPAPTR